MIRYQELDHGKYWAYNNINEKLFSSFDISKMKKAHRKYADQHQYSYQDMHSFLGQPVATFTNMV